MTTTRKISMLITYFTLAGILLLCTYRGILIYKALVAPTTTTAPVSTPKPGKMTYTITLTREVEESKK